MQCRRVVCGPVQSPNPDGPSQLPGKLGDDPVLPDRNGHRAGELHNADPETAPDQRHFTRGLSYCPDIDSVCLLRNNSRGHRRGNHSSALPGHHPVCSVRVVFRLLWIAIQESR